MTEVPDRFSDEEMKAVLARAIDLDEKGVTTTREIREIAQELQISREAVDMALREHAANLSPRMRASGKRATSVLIVAGAALGVVAGSFLNDASTREIVGALAALKLVGLIASGVIIVLEGRAATLRSFNFKNGVFWASVGFGSVAALSLSEAGAIALPGTIIAWCLRSWLASSILGSAAVVAIRRGARAAGPGPSSTSSGTGAYDVGRRVSRAAKRLVHWVSDTFRRETSRLRVARKASCTLRSV